MIYAVIDTNVIVSARITKNSSSATVKVLNNMFNGIIKPIFNDEIIAEYADVLHRPKFRMRDEEINLIINYIKKYGIHSDRVPYEGNMPDEKDRPFYEVSLSVEDSFLVTGNLKHFPVTPKVVTPSQIIAIIEERISPYPCP